MSADLTVAQLIKIQARIHELIKNAKVDDERIETIETPVRGRITEEGKIEEAEGLYRSTQYFSKTKSSVYYNFIGALRLNQFDSKNLETTEFPAEIHSTPPQTVTELIANLSENPFTNTLEHFTGPGRMLAVDDTYHWLKASEALWKQVSEQVIDALPALVTDPRDFVERISR